MTRVRVSTTVDAELLGDVRRLGIASNDASLLDQAFHALLARHRAGEIDLSYEAYDRHPLDEPDDWGDLASFRRKAAESR